MRLARGNRGWDSYQTRDHDHDLRAPANRRSERFTRARRRGEVSSFSPIVSAVLLAISEEHGSGSDVCGVRSREVPSMWARAIGVGFATTVVSYN